MGQPSQKWDEQPLEPNQDKDSNDPSNFISNLDQTSNNEGQNSDFQIFVDLWNAEKSQIWAVCLKLNKTRINLLNRFVKEERQNALETFEKAIKFARNDSFWGKKRMSFENILRHVHELAEKYLETPSGQQVTESDYQQAIEIKEHEDRFASLRQKYQQNNENTKGELNHA